MLSKFELIGELRNIMRTVKSLTFESGVVQDDMYELMADIVTEKIGDGGILRHRLMSHKHRLETALSHFNRVVAKFSIEKKEGEIKQCVGL